MYKIYIHGVIFLCLTAVYAQDSKKDTLSANLKQDYLILLSDEDLNDETSEVNNISGLFSASNDLFLQTVAFEFQGIFFRVRGLATKHQTFLLNGLTQNRFFNGNPAWNNWGGVEGIYRTQLLTEPLGANNKTFGGALGVTSLTTRASKYRPGSRIAFASSNRTYQYKISGNYISGDVGNGLYYLVSASRRWGNQSFRDGTFYDANSLMLSIEKKLENHFINFTTLYTPNRRGLAGTYTDEVFKLKGRNYNGNWGYQNGKPRNSRVRDIKEPIFLLTHTYEPHDKLHWQNSLLYQFGSIGFSRLWYKTTNPNPGYYRTLPSHFVVQGDLEDAFTAQVEFQNNGQFNWEVFYEGNQDKTAGTSDPYVLYEDKRDEKRLQYNSNIQLEISDKLKVNGSLNYRKTFSNNYAEVLDNLGGTGFIDITNFGGLQNNLNNPNAFAKKGDKFRYHYKIVSSQITAFTQLTWKQRFIETYVSYGFKRTQHQRNGIFNPEAFNGYGKGKKTTFNTSQVKLGGLYKLTGRNLVQLQTAYIQTPPTLRELYPNIQKSNQLTFGINNNNLFTNALSYIHRGEKINGKIVTYYNKETNGIENSLYFSSGEESAFFYETVYNIEKEYKGVEFGLQTNISSTIKLSTVAGIGDFRITNNPNLSLQVEDTLEANTLGAINGVLPTETVFLKNLKIASGPQQAYNLSIEYKDPEYWRIKVSLNHFRENYLDYAAIQYREQFRADLANESNENQQFIKQLLNRHIDNFSLVNLSGGKSWRLPKKQGYVSLFWSVQNVLDTYYYSGGFQSSRGGSVSQVLEDATIYRGNIYQEFGPRYFVGNGRTYFLGLSYSF